MFHVNSVSNDEKEIEQQLSTPFKVESTLLLQHKIKNNLFDKIQFRGGFLLPLYKYLKTNNEQSVQKLELNKFKEMQILSIEQLRELGFIDKNNEFYEEFLYIILQCVSIEKNETKWQPLSFQTICGKYDEIDGAIWSEPKVIKQVKNSNDDNLYDITITCPDVSTLKSGINQEEVNQFVLCLSILLNSSGLDKMAAVSIIWGKAITGPQFKCLQNCGFQVENVSALNFHEIMQPVIQATVSARLL